MDDKSLVIALVVHGGALRAFHKASASLDVSAALADLVDNGLVAYACSNTLRAQSVTSNDLLPGFDPAECVGVVMLTQLQGRGYAYIRP
jgi:intracellular sulfur oxidation DsrE/DsrF family protein